MIEGIAATTLVLDIGFIILAGTVFAFIARLLKQPIIVGYIIAGIVVGPIGLKLIGNYSTIGVLSDLGVAFLLFAIAMQIDFSKLWQFKRTIVLGGLAQIAITATAVALLIHFLNFGWIASIYTGLMVAFSSTAIVVKVLSDSRRLNSLEAKLIIGYALVQDLAAVIALPLLANPATLISFDLMGKFLLSLIIIFALAVICSVKIFPKIMSFSSKNQELFYLASISSCFLFIFVAQALNFSIAVGAFIGGLALARVSFSTEALTRIEYIRDLFATIFFVSLGMQLTLSIFSPHSLVLFPILLAIVFILNPIILYIITLYSGFGNKVAWFVALSLAQASEFSFILARQGLNLGQISEPLYNNIIWVILISMVATPYLMGSSDRIANFFHKAFKIKENTRSFFERKLKLWSLPEPRLIKDHIIIAGGGVFGSAIAESLKNSAQIIVVDHDPEALKRLSSKGITAVFASRANSEIWEKLSIESAKAFVVTVPESSFALKLVRKVKKTNPKTVVFVRAHYYRDALDFYNAKADFVVMPAVLGSNTCLEAIESFLETGKMPQVSFQDEFMRVLKEKAEEETGKKQA
ncbi:MAG: cation:proton antiporter [Candidatus ainarchaeum sp.]|nr:cation:proton antiporter [Candidatus ainarchaeum sp.]